MIKDQLQQDVVVLLKAGNREDARLVRDVVSEIKNKEISDQKELTDAEVVGLIRKMVKKLQDANSQFLSGGRDDLAEENNHEIELLQKYLPAELSDEEVEKRVREILEKHPDVDRGPLTGMTVKELSGVVESSRVAQAVNKICKGNS